MAQKMILRNIIKLTHYPIRWTILRLLPPFILIYGLLLPSVLSIQTTESLEATREFFHLAQVFLLLALLWQEFLYFLPIFQKESLELLLALRSPNAACAVILLLEHHALALPFYFVTMAIFPEQKGMLLLLCIQSACITLGFYTCCKLSSSTIAAMTVLLVYVLLVAVPELPIPISLIQGYALWEEISPKYYLFRAGIALLEMSLHIVRKKFQ